MAAVNRHRNGFSPIMSNDNLGQGDVNFTTHCDSLMEGNSDSISHNLELLKEAVFFDSFKNCDDSYDCGKWDGHICCKILYLDKFLLEQSSTTGLCFVNDPKVTVEKIKKFHGNKAFLFYFWFL